MKIIEISLSKIRPDPNQPRKTFNPDKLDELAKTIKTAGVINPIEVDKSYMIITGENRFKAAKLAGLTKTWVKVLDIDDKDRFMRQVIENIQYANLTDFEIAHALKKLLPKKGSSSLGELDYDDRSLKKDEKHKSDYFKGVTWLAEKLGKSKSWVSEHLQLLEASAEFQAAVKKGTTGRLIRAIRSVPKEFQKQLEKKIVNNEFPSSNSAFTLATAINRHPDQAHKLLDIDYKAYKNEAQINEAISKIAPRLSDTILLGQTPYDQIESINKQLQTWLDTTSPQMIGSLRMKGVLITLSTMKTEIDEWIGNKLRLDTSTLKKLD